MGNWRYLWAGAARYPLAVVDRCVVGWSDRYFWVERNFNGQYKKIARLVAR
jgi:hypothetical protein